MNRPRLTREQWLVRAIEALRPWFRQNGYTVPRNVRATCGFPHVGAASRKKQRIGECWPAQSSDGKVFEIFISPVLFDRVEVLATLAHELVHATVGLKAKHGAAFKRCALAIGLKGKMTATKAGEKFEGFAKRALKRLGKYPHKRLRLTSKLEKQTTRLLKCECSECGYTARVTNMWIENAGAPICPLDEIPMEVSE